MAWKIKSIFETMEKVYKKLKKITQNFYRRWCVLTETTFYTFELEKTYKDPTEII